jgi:uncharacterized alkaline shock family protein YloU
MRSDAKVDLGVIQVHKNVIADICTVAIEDVQGVSIARNETLDGFLSAFGVRNNSGVDVLVDSVGQVSVVVKVDVRYGLNLAEVSRRVQDVVMTAVEKMADINLRDVDVNIQGIERN